MSFDFPQKPQPPRGGKGGGILMFLIIGAAFLFIMSSMGRQGEQGGPNGGTERELEYKGLPDSVTKKEDSRNQNGQRSVEVESSRRQAESRPMPKSTGVQKDGWSMDGIGKKSENSSQGSTGKKTTRDGWSMEEVDGKPKGSKPLFEASNKSDSGKEVLSGKTSNDGWSVDEVETSGKTVKDGWSVQEVPRNKKK